MSPRLTACLIAASLLAAVLSPSAASAEASAGRQKAQACAVCHGIDGVAKTPDAANLAGESTIYLTRQLKAFRSGERKHEQMSIIARGLDDEDITDLSDWYSSLTIRVEMPQ